MQTISKEKLCFIINQMPKAEAAKLFGISKHAVMRLREGKSVRVDAHKLIELLQNSNH